MNEGDEGDEQTEFIPATSKRTKHPLVRSGPTSHRQSAQKQSTGSPKVTTISTVKSRKQTITESTVSHSLTGVPTGPLANESSSPDSVTAAIAVTLTLAPIITTNTDATPSFIEPDIEDNSLLAPIGGQPICEDVTPTESRLGQFEVDSEIARIIALEERTSLEKSDDHEQTTPLTVIPAQKANAQPGKDFIKKQNNQTRKQSSQPALTGIQPDPPEAQLPVSTSTDHEAQDQTPRYQRIEIEIQAQGQK